jgi:hypothetical protein
MAKIANVDSLAPIDAAFLARSLLACAGLLALDQSVKVGSLPADLHIPVLKWVVTTKTGTSIPVIVFSIPPGIDLTFQMSPQVEKALGEALVAHAEGDQPPGQPPDRVH